MILEARSYRLHPGKVAEYLALFGRDPEVLPALAPHLAGFWTVEAGELNAVRHLWRYENRAARARARAELAAQPAIQRFFTSVLPLLQHQHSVVLQGDVRQPGPGTGGVYDRIRLRLRPDAGAPGDALSRELATALANIFDPVACLRRLAFEEAGPLCELQVVVRSDSLEQRDARWVKARGLVDALDYSAAESAPDCELLLPAPFSPWR